MKFLIFGVLLGLIPVALAQLPASKNVSGYQGIFKPAVAVTIALSGTVSSSINTGGMALVGIQLPASFTGTAITFKASVDNSTFQVLKSTTSGTTLTYTVAQGTYVAIDPKDFQGVQYLQIVSGSTEASARSFTVALKGL